MTTLQRSGARELRAGTQPMSAPDAWALPLTMHGSAHSRWQSRSQARQLISQPHRLRGAFAMFHVLRSLMGLALVPARFPG